MKTLVIFYSYSGNTKAIAMKLAAGKSADIAEIKDIRRPGKLKAYVGGILAVIRGRTWPIRPLNVDWAAYDRIILLSPVWADNPVPAVMAALEQLPEGKTVAVKLVSMSGKSNCRERVEAAVKAKGSVLEGIEDIKRD